MEQRLDISQSLIIDKINQLAEDENLKIKAVDKKGICSVLSDLYIIDHTYFSEVAQGILSDNEELQKKYAKQLSDHANNILEMDIDLNTKTEQLKKVYDKNDFVAVSRVFGIGFCFTEQEWQDIFTNEIFKLDTGGTNNFIKISNVDHAMVLRYDSKNCYLYDPNLASEKEFALNDINAIFKQLKESFSFDEDLMTMSLNIYNKKLPQIDMPNINSRAMEIIGAKREKFLNKNDYEQKNEDEGEEQITADNFYGRSDEYTESCLHAAVLQDNVVLAQTILAHEVYPDEVNSIKFTPLTQAIKRQLKEITEVILESSIPETISYQNKLNGRNIVIEVAWVWNDIDILKKLLKFESRNLNVLDLTEANDIKSLTELFGYLLITDSEIDKQKFSLLIKHYVDNQKLPLSGNDFNNKSILFFTIDHLLKQKNITKAIKDIFYDNILFLLESGADSNYYSMSGRAILRDIIAQDNQYLIKLLVEHGNTNLLDWAKSDRKDEIKNFAENLENQRNELQQAMLKNDFDKVKELIPNSLSTENYFIDPISQEKLSILQIAVKNRSSEISTYLLSNHADEKNIDWRQEIVKSIAENNLAMVKIIIEHPNNIEKIKRQLKFFTLEKILDEKKFELLPTFLKENNMDFFSKVGENLKVHILQKINTVQDSVLKESVIKNLGFVEKERVSSYLKESTQQQVLPQSKSLTSENSESRFNNKPK